MVDKMKIEPAMISFIKSIPHHPRWQMELNAECKSLSIFLKFQMDEKQSECMNCVFNLNSSNR